MIAPRSPSVADISRALGLPTAPAEWRPTGVVRDALIELKVRCDGDRLTTAWRLATVWSQRWTWESTYLEAAARGLATALASGDDAAAARAALWFVDEGAAMTQVIAELSAAKGGAL